MSRAWSNGLTYNLRPISKNNGVLFVIPAVVFDAMVTGFLTLGLHRRHGSYQPQMPLTTLVIQDGLLYFAAVFASNILWILVHVLSYNNWASYFS